MPVLPLVGSTIVAAGLDLAVALGRLDHRHADPVLDRSAGVEVLELGHHLARRALAEPAQLDQRRVADHGRRLGGDPATRPDARETLIDGHATECGCRIAPEDRLRCGPPFDREPRRPIPPGRNSEMSDRRMTTRIRALLLAAGCAALLGLAACGGDDDSTSTEAASTTSTTTTADSDTTTSIPEDAIDAGALRDEFNKQLLTVLTRSRTSPIPRPMRDRQARGDGFRRRAQERDRRGSPERAAATGPDRRGLQRRQGVRRPVAGRRPGARGRPP